MSTTAANRSHDGAPVVEFDLASFRGQTEANAAHADLRSRCPVAWSDDSGGAWIASRYDVVAEGFRNWEVFRSGRDVRSIPGPGGSRDMPSTMVIPIESQARMIPLELDPPIWLPYRRVFASLLSPAGVTKLAPRITHWVTRFIDDVIETGGCDIVATLTSAVPGAVALEWLGFPEEDWHRMSAAVHNVAEVTPQSPDIEHYMDELNWAFQRIEEEVTARRDNPRDDVISLMANFEIDGALVPLDFAIGMVNLAYSGGVDTTTAATTAAIVHMHHHPDVRQRLIEHPELVDSAIEEFLRFYTPVRNQGRTVVEDTELGGCRLRKDDRIILSLISANHDESAFPDPEEFIIDRFPNRNMAFGMGLHRCPGSHLARAEFKEMLTQVLQRLPDYRIVEDGLREYPHWYAMGGWSTVPITFTPGARRA